MKIQILDQRHPSYDAEDVGIHRALYAGGKALLNPTMVRAVLTAGANEPVARYEARCKRAHYVNHCAPVVDNLVAGLYGTEAACVSDPDTKDDPFWQEFMEDCDLRGSDFNQFRADRFRESLLTGHGWTLIELPKRQLGVEVASRADEDAQGMRRAYLVPLDTETVIDWQYDDIGQLVWGVVKNVSATRMDPLAERGLLTYSWTVYTRAGYQRYEWKQPNAKTEPRDSDEAALVDEGVHTFGAVPIVDMEMPDGLYLLGKIDSHLVEAFNTRNALSWASYSSLHATLVLNSDDDEIGNRTFGNGYGIRIGREDKIAYLEPSGNFASIAMARISELKDELFRVVQQMAQSADSSAAAMGRSAESKAADTDSTEVVLSAYAQLDAKATEKILDLVSAGRGDGVDWTVTPADNFISKSTADVLADVTSAEALNVPSKTFAKHMYEKAVRALLPDIGEDELNAIRQEIEDAVSTGEHPMLAITAGLSTARKGIQPAPEGSELEGEASRARDVAATAGLRASNTAATMRPTGGMGLRAP